MENDIGYPTKLCMRTKLTMKRRVSVSLPTLKSNHETRILVLIINRNKNL